MSDTAEAVDTRPASDEVLPAEPASGRWGGAGHEPTEPEPDGPVLGRDEILAADDLQTARVAVPEWGGVVIVRGLTAAERDHYEAGFLDAKAAKRGTVSYRLGAVRARLVALTVVDEAGKRQFGDADVKALERKSAAAMDRVVTKARELAGMTQEDLEELAEGFEDDPSDD